MEVVNVSTIMLTRKPVKRGTVISTGVFRQKLLKLENNDFLLLFSHKPAVISPQWCSDLQAKTPPVTSAPIPTKTPKNLAGKAGSNAPHWTEEFNTRTTWPTSQATQPPYPAPRLKNYSNSLKQTKIRQRKKMKQSVEKLENLPWFCICKKGSQF